MSFRDCCPKCEHCRNQTVGDLYIEEILEAASKAVSGTAWRATAIEEVIPGFKVMYRRPADEVNNKPERSIPVYVNKTELAISPDHLKAVFAEKFHEHIRLRF